jgi:hypothetical protein
VSKPLGRQGEEWSNPILIGDLERQILVRVIYDIPATQLQHYCDKNQFGIMKVNYRGTDTQSSTPCAICPNCGAPEPTPHWLN